MNEIRLQKFLAVSGVASRRKSEELILEGKVKVNGITVTELGTKIDPETDVISYDGKTLTIEEKKVYYLLNKPVGYVTTAQDQFNRPNVVDIITDCKFRIYPVGRLDYNTSGLLILTNDGELTNKITHPANHVEKTYIVKCKGILSKQNLERLKTGIDIGGYITQKAKAEVIKVDGRNTIVKITISEGKNRQIRKMFDAVCNPVIDLKRVSIGKIKVDGIEIGKYRELTNDELKYLKSL